MLNSMKTCTTALPSCSFITLAEIEFQNVCLSTFEFLSVLSNTLTADEKYSLCNKKNLLQPIQLQLSKKQKICSQFFPGYLKCT